MKKTFVSMLFVGFLVASPASAMTFVYDFTNTGLADFTSLTDDFGTGLNVTTLSPLGTPPSTSLRMATPAWRTTRST